MKNLTSLRILFVLVSTSLLISCGSDGSGDQAENSPQHTTQKDQKNSPFPNYKEELTDEDFTTFINGEKVSTKEIDALQYLKMAGDLSQFAEIAYKSAVIRTHLQEVKPIVFLVPTDSVINSMEGSLFEKEKKGNLEADARNAYLESYIFIQKARNAVGDTLWIKNQGTGAGPYPLVHDDNGWHLKKTKVIGEPVRVQNGLVFRINKTF